MLQFVAHIVVTAFLLFLLGKLIDGIEVRDGTAAVLGALALGLANAVVGPVLVLLTLPVTILTLGLFLLVINAVTLMVAAVIVPGFSIKGFGAALWGSVGLAVMNFVVERLLG